MPADVDLSKVEFSSPFYGDDRDAENGFLFIRELEKAAIIYDAAAHPKIIWVLSLESEAKAWWKEAGNWTGKNKDDIEVVVEAFELKWPAPSASPKKQHERMAEFSGLTLSDEDVGRKFLDGHGAESTRHVWFVKELRKKAYAAGDTNAKNLMLPQALARIPPRLAKAIGDTCVDIQTWEELVTKTEAVSRAKIEQVTADEKKQKILEERLAKIEGKTPEPAPMPANSSANSLDRDTQNSFPYQRSPARFPYTVSPARAPPRVPVARLAASTPSPSIDPLADVVPRTNKTIKLMHENTVQGWKEFAQAQRDWEDKWGADMLPTAAWPYPLQPGGAELGSGCWNCGLDGHFKDNCSAPEADRLSVKETYWCQAQSQNRSGPPRTPNTFRPRPIFGNSPIGAFQTPPRAPHTPTPAFRRQQPPHFRPTAGDVLMVVDSQGYYYGDLDTQAYGPVVEWEEVHGAYPEYYQQGNGNGSNGF
ncbi:hypothetical protein FB451DRAFT_1549546 [Mycena latifolia]|nr:hypothetical protein FB451DRAFT_1549546 [Mycena latifolia]